MNLIFFWKEYPRQFFTWDSLNFGHYGGQENKIYVFFYINQLIFDLKHPEKGIDIYKLKQKIFMSLYLVFRPFEG
jgi:hypothetical protein